MSVGSSACGATANETKFRSLDGTRLRGTLLRPEHDCAGTVVLVHGAGVARDEGGFFTRLAAGLANSGFASLRFDFRAHGESEGTQAELTLCGVAYDIRAAVEHASHETGAGPVALVGASFGGGLSAMYAADFPAQVSRLVLFNPLIDYKRRFVDEKPYWANDYINDEAGQKLAAHGLLGHSSSFALSRAVLNEVFYVRPDMAVGRISVPTLILHGTKDTFIPVESSRKYVAKIPAPARLIEIEGAQHGFAVHDDPGYAHPQSRQWQSFVIESVCAWLHEPQ
jgi:alpha-beta hydrolase superfamily lysophospholipase